MISGGSDKNDAVNRTQGYFENCSIYINLIIIIIIIIVIIIIFIYSWYSVVKN